MPDEGLRWPWKVGGLVVSRYVADQPSGLRDFFGGQKNPSTAGQVDFDVVGYSEFLQRS